MNYGIIGVIFLILAYILFIFSYIGFLIADIIGTFFLLLHAIKLKDKIFILVNGWILIVLIYKFFAYLL